ncbi:NADH oxidase [Spiroplasma clarkii]|uniref:CoA-disulfide reductase n=1 Tax=Spiroplasma clarkii TaxID=2139 RepID=UPI000B54CE95|nr:CoA-disulfide reductase [Spiroplasma clarkii]ARU91983.1 NADH oxidase [Spiroplasma clarkii]
MKTIIVGGSATGMGVAARLKRNDPNATIVVYQEKSYVSLGACGLPYFVAGNFSDPNNLIARSITAFEENGIIIVPNTQVFKIDFENKLVYFDNKTDSYDNLVIATGATPYIPPLVGVELKNVYTLTTLEDGIELKKAMQNPNIKNVAVIGAGFIGLEMSETLSELNKNVHLFELEERISPNAFDPEFSQFIKENLEKNKINVHLSTKVTEIKGTDQVQAVVLADNSLIEVDAVVLALGFRPNTEILRNTKLALAENGAIIIDETGHTNIDHVYSGGDAATSSNYITGELIYSPLATVASKIARVIADNIANKPAKFVGSIRSAVVRVFDLGYARTGLGEFEAKKQGYQIRTVLIKDKDQTNYVNGQTDLYLKIIMDIKSRQILGAQMSGAVKAMQRINTLAALIWSKVPVDEALEQIDLIYAPPFARTTDILHIALAKLNK